MYINKLLKFDCLHIQKIMKSKTFNNFRIDTKPFIIDRHTRIYIYKWQVLFDCINVRKVLVYVQQSLKYVNRNIYF